jgi:hypothetical protein
MRMSSSLNLLETKSFMVFEEKYIVSIEIDIPNSLNEIIVSPKNFPHRPAIE